VGPSCWQAFCSSQVGGDPGERVWCANLM